MSKINRTNFTEEFNEELDMGQTSINLPVGNVKGLASKFEQGRISIVWKDPENLTVLAKDSTVLTLAEWSGTKIVRKLGSAPMDEHDGELIVDSRIRNAYSVTGFVDVNVVEGDTYFYRAFPYTTKGVVTKSSSISATVKANLGPGSGTIIGGDMNTGFFGEVPVSELINGNDLAAAVGLTVGVNIGSATSWLKFISDDKILFVSKKPYRHSLSWNHLNSAGIIYGNRIIKINDNFYRVRLMRGAISDPAVTAADNPIGAKGSEWNRLMLPIHIKAKKKSWQHPNNVEADIPDWGIGYTDLDLYAGVGQAFTICQEKLESNNTHRVVRGAVDISFTGPVETDRVNEGYAWRPVLELVDRSELNDLTGSPGSPILKAGDKTAGFFGEVPNPELITPTNLASVLGLTTGTSFNTSTPWLKFVLDGKILFSPKKAIRHSIHWDYIDAVKAVDGSRIIKIGELYYKVRLWRGSQNNPAIDTDVDKDCVGSEWNRLLLPIHIRAKDQSWRSANLVETKVPDWGIGYTDADFGITSQDSLGIYRWTQEYATTTGTNTRVVRGSGESIENYMTQVRYSANGSAMGWLPVLELIDPSEYGDTTGSPGPKSLKAGDLISGFFGEVLSSELITGDALATAVNLTFGTSQYSDTPWLKFSLDGKILFTPKKSIRHSISWNTLAGAQLISGNRTIKIGDTTYKVRLWRGAQNLTSMVSDSDRDAKGSEWNRLMLPIHAEAPNAWMVDNTSNQLFAGVTDNWNIRYNNGDLLTHYNSGKGSYTWCQEIVSSNNRHRVVRGGTGISSSSFEFDTSQLDLYGWRPVLEVVKA